jgi:hypothetical protein
MKSKNLGHSNETNENSKFQTLGMREASAQHEEKNNMRRVNNLPIKTHNP